MKWSSGVVEQIGRSAPIGALVILLLGAALVGWVVGAPLDEEGQRFVLRASAAVSAVLFTIGFLTVRADEPARRRPVWIAFGTNHAFHLGVIIAFDVAPWSAPTPASALIVGGIGYVVLGAATLLRLRGRVLVRVGWYLWFVFTVTYISRALDRPFTSGSGAFALLAIAAGRVVVARRHGGPDTRRAVTRDPSVEGWRTDR